MKHFVRHIILFLMIATVTGCYDEFMKEEIIGEGKASISATLDFKPMSSTLSRTRAAGDALKDISSLHVLLYDKDKNLKNKWKIEGYSESDENRTDKDAEANPNGEHHTAETTTKRATFKLPEEIDFGKYYMYAVANIPDLLTNTSYDDAIKTVDGLKNIPLTWNSEEVANNGEMIGFLRRVENDGLPHAVAAQQVQATGRRILHQIRPGGRNRGPGKGMIGRPGHRPAHRIAAVTEQTVDLLQQRFRPFIGRGRHRQNPTGGQQPRRLPQQGTAADIGQNEMSQNQIEPPDRQMLRRPAGRIERCGL